MALRLRLIIQKTSLFSFVEMVRLSEIHKTHNLDHFRLLRKANLRKTTHCKPAVLKKYQGLIF